MTRHVLLKPIFIVSFILLLVGIPFILEGKFISAQNSIKPRQIVGFYSDLPMIDSFKLKSQIAIDPSISVREFTMDNFTANELLMCQILVCAAPNFPLSYLTMIEIFISSGGSLFLLPTQNFTMQLAIYDLFHIIKSNSSLKNNSNPSVFAIHNRTDPFVSEIRWESSPDIKSFMIINSTSQVNILLCDKENSAPLFFRSNYGSGQILGTTIYYTKTENWDFQLWWYTPYWIYRALMLLSNQIPLTFNEWNYSPIPHLADKIAMGIFIIGIIGITTTLYLFAKKKSRIPIKINTTNFVYGLKKPSSKTIVNESPNENNKLESPTKDGLPLTDWEKIGLHRQISSMLMNLITNIFINLPMLFISLSVYNRYIQPFPLLSGTMGWVGGLFGSVFIILDFGIGAALTKYMAEYRIQSPSKAIGYAQIFVWWFIFITVAQAIVSILLVIFIVPSTYLPYMGFFIFYSSITHIPGMFGIIGAIFDSLQRFDIKIKLNAILGTIVNTPISYLIILASRNYYSHIPQYGEAYGAAMGVYLGGYLCGIVDFIVFLVVYKKMGFYVGNLFRVDFKKEHLKEALGFGGKLTVGNSWRAVAGVVESFLISLYVLSFGSELGYYGMTGHLSSLLGVISAFLGALTPAISEAFGNNAKKLTEYYLVEGIKWLNFFLFFVLGLMSAVGSNIILLAGPQWTGALKFISWHLFFAAFWPMAWYADTVFQGTGHTGYNTAVWIIEQGTRLLLLFILLPKYQIYGMLLAYIPGIIAKDITSIIIIRKKIIAFHFYWMHTFVIPLISALIMFGSLYLLQVLFFHGNLIIGFIIVLIGFLGGLHFYGFLNGFLGGFDDNSLSEFRRGVKVVPITTKMFKYLLKATETGHRLSPWKNRFAVELYTEAQLEAENLTKIENAFQNHD